MLKYLVHILKDLKHVPRTSLYSTFFRKNYNTEILGKSFYYCRVGHMNISYVLFITTFILCFSTDKLVVKEWHCYF